MAEVYFNAVGELMLAGDNPRSISEHFRSLSAPVADSDLRLECLRLAAHAGMSDKPTIAAAARMFAFIQTGAQDQT